MPIRDYNGTTGSEIARLYDDDGSVFSQIGKVYDNDGTADRLIYNAEMPLFTNGKRDVAWTGLAHGSNPGTCSASATELVAETRYEDGENAIDKHVGWYTTSKISVDSYKTLQFVFSEIYVRWGECDYVVCGLTSDPNMIQPYVIRGLQDFMNANCGWVACRINLNDVNVRGTFTNITHNIDISSITGSYYVCALAVSRFQSARQSRFKMTQAILREEIL